MAEKVPSSRRRLAVNLPPGLSTRSQNKNRHPGAPDLPNPRRSKAEVIAANAAEEEDRQARAQTRKDAIDRAAAVENRLQVEDEGNTTSGNLLPVEIASDKVNNTTQEDREVEYGSGDDGSIYQPNASPLERSDHDSDSEGIDVESEDSVDLGVESAGKKKTSKKKVLTARASVQAARFSNQTTVGKRKLEVDDSHGKGPMETSTKRTKKAPIGGLNANWEEHAGGRGRHATKNSSRSSRAHSGASAGSTVSSSSGVGLTHSSHADSDSDPKDGDGVQLATFADDSDTAERSMMADLVENLTQLRTLKKQARQQGASNKAKSNHDVDQGSRAQFTKVQNLTAVTPKDAPLTSSRRTTRSGKETSKPRNSDIPDGMRELWQKVFVPLARQRIGTLRPWASLDIDQVREIYKCTWPNVDYVVQKGDVFWNLIQYRITDWRSSIGAGGVSAVDRVVAENNDVLNSPTLIKEFVEYNLGDGDKAVPFHWEKWNKAGERKGVYASEMILMALAPHIAELNRIPAHLQSKDYPKGALILAIQAVERGLTLWRTGVKASTNAPTMWFSEDNWGDTIKVKQGGTKHQHDRRATKYLKVIDQWSAEKWQKVLDGAKAYCIEVQSDSNKGRSLLAPIVVEEDEDDGYYISSD